MGYQYDLGGNIRGLQEHIKDCGTGATPNALLSQSDYDPIKRLLSATGRESDTQTNDSFWTEKAKPNAPNAEHTRNYTRTYDYDKLGNIKTLNHVATGFNFTRGYNYAAGLNQLNSIDNAQSSPTNHAAYTYDEVGNQLQVNSERFYEWDVADQLKYFKLQAGAAPTTEAKYLYSGGTRLKKHVTDQQGNLEVTVYIDGVYEHRYKKNSAGVLQAQQNIIHIMDGRSRIATKRIGDDFGDSTAAIKYNLENHLGSSTTRLDDTGNLIDREEFYPFGDSSLRTFEKKRYRYVGKEKDSESGLYYYGARYYSAWTCRFISIDPLAESYAQLNPYNYAAQNPIGDLDIDGMQSTEVEKSTSDSLNYTGPIAEPLVRTNPIVLDIPIFDSEYAHATEEEIQAMDNLLQFLSGFGKLLDKLDAATKGSSDEWDYGVIIESEKKQSGNYEDSIKLDKYGTSITVSYEVIELFETVGSTSRMYDVAKFRPGSKMEKQQTKFNDWRKKYNGRGITNKMLKNVKASEARFIKSVNDGITNSRNQNMLDGLKVISNFIALQLTKQVSHEDLNDEESAAIDSDVSFIVVYDVSYSSTKDSTIFEITDTTTVLDGPDIVRFKLTLPDGRTTSSQRKVPLLDNQFILHETDSLISR